jgi:hypothetical protein
LILIIYEFYGDGNISTFEHVISGSTPPSFSHLAEDVYRTTDFYGEIVDDRLFYSVHSNIVNPSLYAYPIDGVGDGISQAQVVSAKQRVCR